MIKSLFTSIFKIILFIQKVILSPIKKVWLFIRPAWIKYKALFYKYTHDKYGDFILKRAVAFVATTLVSLWLSLIVVEFLFDTVYYLATKRTETIYLSDSVELETDKSLWGVKGCPTKDCNSDTALYFRIKLTWFNSVWSLLFHQKMFYPDSIAAGVPTGQTECQIVSYGLRYRILMLWNYYPQIIDVKCHSEKSS